MNNIKDNQSLAQFILRLRNQSSFFIPKIISIIHYPYYYLVNYVSSLKLFCQLSLIPKTPNRTS